MSVQAKQNYQLSYKDVNQVRVGSLIQMNYSIKHTDKALYMILSISEKIKKPKELYSVIMCDALDLKVFQTYKISLWSGILATVVIP